MCLLVLEVENRKEKENRNPIGNPNPTQQLKAIRPTLSPRPSSACSFFPQPQPAPLCPARPKAAHQQPTRARSARPFSPRRARLALTPPPTRRARSSGSPSTSRNGRARRPQISARLPSRRTLPRSPTGLYLASHDSPVHLIPPRRHPQNPSRRTSCSAEPPHPCAAVDRPSRDTRAPAKQRSSTASPPGVSPKQHPSTLARVAPESDPRTTAGEQLRHHDFTPPTCLTSP